MNNSNLVGVLEMDPESTRFYVDLIRSNGFKNVDLKFFKTDFERINNLLPNRSELLDNLIHNALKKITKVPLSVIIIPNITIHETVDAVDQKIRTKIPISHPLFGTIERVHQNKSNKAIIFGSKFTMTSTYVQHNFAVNGIEIVSPSKTDIEFIDRVRRQVYAGTSTQEIADEFNNLTLKYSMNNQILIVGCTELSRILRIHNANILDMARIQVENLTRFIRT